MKSLSVKLGVVLIGLLILGNAEVWGADWKPYDHSRNYWGYYDAQSITRPSENVVRVWVKHVYTEEGVMDMVGSFGKIYENLSYSLILNEINCVEKKYRILSAYAKDNKGKVIHSSNDPTSWDFLPPDSMGDRLSKEVCK
jgi:hypothetical protein